MPGLYSYRLFISHAWKYDEAYQRIISFLDAASNFSYANYSVPEAKAFEGLNSTQLGEQLKNQLRPTQIAIVLGGMYVSHSGWIQYEIDSAKQMGKPILGIRPWGSVMMPSAVTLAATRIVGWNTDSIVSAIRELVP